MSRAPAASPHARFTKGLVTVLSLAILGVAAVSLILTTAYTGPAEFEFSGSILNGTITVDANSYEATHFIVPAGAHDIILQGTFSTSGKGQEVSVDIMSSADYNNWKDGHRLGDGVFFESGRVSSANISVRLPNQGETTYYVVFDNTLPFSSAETVDARLDIRYRVELGS